MSTINAIGTNKITLANTLTTAGNFPLTITSTNTTNSTLPAGSTTLVPTTGTGATGTWGIDISGNAATATSAATVTTNANLTGDVTSIGNATTITTTPGFRAQVSASVDTLNVTGDGTYYTLAAYTDVIFDTLSNFNPTTGLFTAPIAGVYQFNGVIWIYNLLLNVFSEASFGFIVNGAQQANFILNPFTTADSATNLMVNCSEIFHLNINDTVGLYVQVGFGTKTINLQGSSRISGKFLGT